MGYLEDLMGKNEQIVLTTRQHWITIVGALLVNGFFILQRHFWRPLSWGHLPGPLWLWRVYSAWRRCGGW
jgi:hypothetical protein